jgi:protoheme IX farnesyltransferase
MVLAAGGLPSPVTVLATLVGGSLAAGSANALKLLLRPATIDAVMRRTVNRAAGQPGRPPERTRRSFGGVLGVLAVAILGCWSTRWPPAGGGRDRLLYGSSGTRCCSSGAHPQNIVWGGAAGCMPVLIGWAAVRGPADWAALVLFGIVFLWTPPHYWPLSLRFTLGLRGGGVPMLPVVAAPVQVARRVVAYSCGDGRLLAAADPGGRDRLGVRAGSRGPGRELPLPGARAASGARSPPSATAARR